MKSLLVLVLAVGAIAIPALAQPEPGPAAAVDQPAVAYCPIEEGSGRTTVINVASTASGPMTLATFASGTMTGSVETEIGASGGASVAIADVAALGTAGSVLDLPSSDASAISVIAGSTSISAETCPPAPAGHSLLGGGSTLSGQSFVVQLMNPYAGEAIVDLVIESDAGLESNPELEGVIVPARSSAVIDLAEILPGRAWMNVALEVTQGGAITVGRLAIGDDEAIWNAEVPAQDWFVTVPHGLESHQVVIAADNAAVEYQIDVYTPDGLEEAHGAGEIEARGQAIFEVGEVTPVASAVRVVSTGPVSVFLRVSSGTGLAMTGGAITPSSAWLLPGAGSIAGATGSMIVLNPGLEDVNASLLPFRDGGTATEVLVPAGEVVEVAVPAEPAQGYEVTGDGDLVTGWSIVRGGSFALGGGTAIGDD